MRVRTIRKHINRYPPQPTKNIGRQYEVSEAEAGRLIASGLVEAVDGNAQDG